MIIPIIPIIIVSSLYNYHYHPLSSLTQLGSGLLEFGEFCQLAAKFLVEEDEEALKKELKEAFR